MQDALRVLAGDCTITYDDGDDRREQRGDVVVLAKPDGTVLVHDADGYQPAAWLTRADTVRVARDAGGFRLVAGKSDERLYVASDADRGHAHYRISPAGPAVGDCPDCDGVLVRDGGRVICVGCRRHYSIPRDAAVTDDACPDCGLPVIRALRGDAFEVCLDRDCESLDDAVAARFDGAWDCPECDRPLAIRRDRGLRAVCEGCDRSIPVPTGETTGTCGCGLPTFETAGGRRCADPRCDAS